jgi:hypothetical protein
MQEAGHMQFVERKELGGFSNGESSPFGEISP